MCVVITVQKRELKRMVIRPQQARRTSSRQPACSEESERVRGWEQSSFYTLPAPPLSGVANGPDGLLPSAADVTHCGSRPANSEAEGGRAVTPPPIRMGFHHILQKNKNKPN